jgi:DNA replicative helicase MCM subunit Mcm2 (Cdc46/Mcm family)
MDIQVIVAKEETQNEEFQLMFFECPKCGKRIYVQADDEDTLQSLERCKLFMRKFAALKKNGKKPNRKQLADYNKESKYLALSRKELKLRLTGKSLLDSTGNILEIKRFDYDNL